MSVVSVGRWTRPCSGGHFMPQLLFVLACFGFFCAPGLVCSFVRLGHSCTHLEQCTSTCKVTTSIPVHLAKKSTVSLFTYSTRANELLSVRPACLTPDLAARLRSLDTGFCLPQRRTRRGGRRKVKKISVVSCPRTDHVRYRKRRIKDFVSSAVVETY